MAMTLSLVCRSITVAAFMRYAFIRIHTAAIHALKATLHGSEGKYYSVQTVLSGYSDFRDEPS
jgi:hypothetical protein